MDMMNFSCLPLSQVLYYDRPQMLESGAFILDHFYGPVFHVVDVCLSLVFHVFFDLRYIKFKS